MNLLYVLHNDLQGTATFVRLKKSNLKFWWVYFQPLLDTRDLNYSSSCTISTNYTRKKWCNCYVFHSISLHVCQCGLVHSFHCRKRICTYQMKTMLNKIWFNSWKILAGLCLRFCSMCWSRTNDGVLTHMLSELSVRVTKREQRGELVRKSGTGHGYHWRDVQTEPTKLPHSVET